MRAPASHFTRAAFIIIASLSVLTAGCRTPASQHPAIDEQRVQENVRAVLDRWVQSFESRNEAAVRSVLTEDDRFVWLEDGEARYQSVDEVVAALASFPPGLRFAHQLTSVRIVPMSKSAAWAQLATLTEIRHGEQLVSEFAGAVLMLVRHEHGEWRIVAAHTSTTKPQTRNPG